MLLLGVLLFRLGYGLVLSPGKRRFDVSSARGSLRGIEERAVIQMFAKVLAHMCMCECACVHARTCAHVDVFVRGGSFKLGGSCHTECAVMAWHAMPHVRSFPNGLRLWPVRVCSSPGLRCFFSYLTGGDVRRIRAKMGAVSLCVVVQVGVWHVAFPC